MKISDQNLSFSAEHFAQARTHRERVHETYQNGQLASRETQIESIGFKSHQLINRSQSALSQTVLNLQNNPLREDLLLANQQAVNQNQIDSTAALSDQIKLPGELIKMIEAIEAVMERLTGKPFRLDVFGYTPEDRPVENRQDTVAWNPLNLAQQSAQFNIEEAMSANTIQGERWTLNTSHYEEEYSDFNAQGHVQTEDGRSIAFDFNAQMHRQFASQISIERVEGLVVKDPLVVNFGGSPASLTIDKVEFDIDSDGEKDRISFVNPGSGFLAYDKNGDGTINNGTELFGAKTGDGFTELSQYDSDGNGWIDENDPIFSQLQIWHKDANGFEQLQGLLELNIGAIALKNIETPFALKDQNNDQHGQVVSSGIFLHETGQAGSVQQIDLVV